MIINIMCALCQHGTHIVKHFGVNNVNSKIILQHTNECGSARRTLLKNHHSKWELIVFTFCIRWN